MNKEISTKNLKEINSFLFGFDRIKTIKFNVSYHEDSGNILIKSIEDSNSFPIPLGFIDWALPEYSYQNRFNIILLNDMTSFPIESINNVRIDSSDSRYEDADGDEMDSPLIDMMEYCGDFQESLFVTSVDNSNSIARSIPEILSYYKSTDNPITTMIVQMIN